MSAAALAAAAEALIGAPFRLHGRDPASGLDCIGVIEAALARAGRRVRLPTGYRLRNADIAAILPDPAACGLSPAQGAIERGDVVLLQPGPAQFHFAIALGANRFVHAHAGLRRVVIQPQAGLGTPLGHWRLLS